MCTLTGHPIPGAVGAGAIARRYGHRPMRDYYEELWGSLPEELEPPDRELRLAFLRGALRPQDTVLDLGCGDGWCTSEIAASGAAVIGADVAEAALERARARHAGLHFRRIDPDSPLPFADNSFTLVWASEVIEHVADTARWLSEVRRVLAPGARLMITTPSHGRLRLLLGGIERFSEPLGDHLHLYTRRSLARLLDEFGFEDVVVRSAGGPPLLRHLLLAAAVR
jgi:SAM-dependent methyltransferase